MTKFLDRNQFFTFLLIVVAFILGLSCQPAHAEDWFSYSAKNLDHKALHFVGSAFLELSGDAILGDPILALPIGCLPMLKEFDDMNAGEPLSYAIGDWCVDGAGVFVGAVTCGELRAAYYKKQLEITWRF